MTDTNESARTRGWPVRLIGAVLALGVGASATPALADHGGWGGVGFGISISGGHGGGHSSGGHHNGGFTVGYSSPVYVYAGGPRHHDGGHGEYYGGYYGGSHGGYYGGHGGGHYENSHHYRPSYRQYYRPNYYDRGYYRPSYRSYPRSHHGSGHYSLNGESGGWSMDGFQTAGVRASDSGILRYRSETYAGDPNLADPGFKVVTNRTDMDRAETLDPQWAAGAIAMLRKGEADEAIVALEHAAYPEAFGLQTAGFSPIASQPQEANQSAPEGVISDMNGSPSAFGNAALPAAAANPEAIRMLGLAMIADGQVDEGAAKITEAYRLDPSLASSPIDERLFPTGSRFDVRDLVRKVSIRANRTNAPEAWFALGVLMQAEDRDSVALDMVLKASSAGLDQSIISPMADSLRRVVYGRG